MRKLSGIAVVVGLLMCSVVCLVQPRSVMCQQTASAVKDYRGSVGGSNFQMRLTIQGNNVSGTYSYDSVGEDLKLTGHLDEQGKLELSEFSTNGKQTGKFTCKRKIEYAIDSECTWSKPDGTREAYVNLVEQHLAFTNGLQITPKVIANRKVGLRFSYPQITSSSGKTTPAAESFNRRVSALVQKRIKDFQPEGLPGHNSFETNYYVLLATDEIVSIEMTEYWDAGGAHPNSGFWAINYDLSANKEPNFDDLFKPGSDYKTAIAKYAVADIDKRAVAMEQEDARREGRKAEQRTEPIVTIDQLSEISDWALTPEGLVVYFDFPHAISVFDRTLIPYPVVSKYLKPDSPAARIEKP
jgi:hypothetical protein